ncbi:topless-related protein 4-like isoform X3 [Quercus robur]|uniref:topless-related protein 4-like isoform X3 n=1 Tax=Quercus robur TaxID=38942 RepID=UPI002161887B|nr:topless-related protein 4-like isoform X3 [Quercus robur]
MERREKQRIERAERAKRRERQRNYSDKDDDFFDSLPDSLLIHILSYLPTRDSIITSTLSRRWRYLWTLIPFDFSKSKGLPTAVVVNLNQGSAVNSMDFHPSQQTLLLSGTNVGDITIWKVGRRERLVSRNFNVWDVKACSIALQALLASDYTASVNRVMWSPDGALFGVAYSKHIVQIYSYHGGHDLRNHLEIDAHVGKVSDLSFSHPNRQLCIITCGEDKTIKVWDAVTGNKLYTSEGHDAPVYSVCPHPKGNIPFIISVDIDGKIKTWSYDNCCSRVDYVAWGQSCMRMAYSAEGTRLFICGTSRGGESYLVEWNKCKEAIKRVYHGLWKQSVGVVQFDTMKSQFLATGDESQIKFWDMDKGNILTTTAAEDGLPVSPCIRFNKEGVLLAVSTSQKGIKILANADGVRLLHSIENTFRVAPTTIARVLVSYSRSFPDTKPDEVEKSKAWKLTEFNEPSQLCSLQLPDCLWPVQLCLWSMDGWEKHTSKFLRIPPGRVSSPLARTRVQFHQDQIHVLAVHETQIAIYEAPMLDCLKQWFPPESSGSVTDATYSCDGRLIYASIEDGSVCVLTAFTLQLSSRAYPLVIAAHPSKPNQFAIGLTDGGVHVIEPPESEGSWCVAPVLENGVVPSANSAAGSG